MVRYTSTETSLGTGTVPGDADDVVAGTRARYIEAYERSTGEPFQAWLDRTGG